MCRVKGRSLIFFVDLVLRNLADEDFSSLQFRAQVPVGINQMSKPIMQDNGSAVASCYHHPTMLSSDENVGK